MSAVRLALDPGAAGGLARLTLARPDKRNALDLAAVAELRAALTRLHGASARAVIVDGEGGGPGAAGVFSAGLEFADIFRIDGSDNPFTAACDALAALPMPTVCAVGDGAYGAGADLALACDFRVGAAGCRVRVPAAALGVHYDASGITRAVRVMGLQGARRLFLAAEPLAAAELLRLGFLDEVVPGGEVAARVAARAAALAALAPPVLRDLKRSLAEIAAGDADAAILQARVERSWNSPEFREGATARAERRRPEFGDG